MKITTFNNLDEITGNEGKILLYDEAKSKIGASTETVNEIIQDQVGGDIFRLEGRVSTVESDVETLNGAIALKADADKVYTKMQVDEKFADFGGFEVAEGTGEDSYPNVENPDVKKIYLVKKGTKKDKYCEWIWTKEEDSSENTWVLIGETTVELTDYAKTVDVDAALELKEDKVFIAEYGVTPYADIKAAYDAGKQIVCKYYEDKERWPEFVRLLRLSQYLPMGNCFYFDALTNDKSNIYVSCGYYNDDTHWTYSNNSFYNKTETSGSQQLADAFNAKQDKLTFAGENNTITSINTSAVGTTLAAGTDLVINNGVIGVNTNGIAEGQYAFVEGNNTSAIGNGSHAEGISTSAVGDYSHAGGLSSIADGSASFAHGIGENGAITGEHKDEETGVWVPITANIKTIASGIGAVAFGYGNSAIGNYAIAGGQVSIASGINAIAIGGEEYEDYDGIIHWGNSALNDAAVAFGDTTLASGTASFAEGMYTEAIGKYSHAEGKATKAIGDYSHAEGSNTNAKGPYSHVEGADAIAVSYDSHAEGYGTSAIGYYSHAEGFKSSAVGYCTHAEGSATSAVGSASHAEGYSALANGNNSHAEGSGTSATGRSSHAEGETNIAAGRCSHAEGGGTEANGNASHTEGYNTSALNDADHAEGWCTIAAGYYSHAEGMETIASGYVAHTEGNYTTAIGDYSHAGGRGTLASGEATTVIGKYNSVNSAAFIVGNGNWDGEDPVYSDAFIVDWAGVASATKFATSGIQDVEATVKSKLDTSAIQFVSTSAEAVAGTQGVIYIVTGTNA